MAMFLLTIGVSIYGDIIGVVIEYAHLIKKLRSFTFYTSQSFAQRYFSYYSPSHYYESFKMTHLITGNKFDPNKDIPNLSGKVLCLYPSPIY